MGSQSHRSDYDRRPCTREQHADVSLHVHNWYIHIHTYTHSRSLHTTTTHLHISTHTPTHTHITSTYLRIPTYTHLHHTHKYTQHTFTGGALLLGYPEGHMGGEVIEGSEGARREEGVVEGKKLRSVRWFQNGRLHICRQHTRTHAHTHIYI